MNNHAPAPYLHYVLTAAEHTLTMMPTKRLTYLALFLAFSPVLIPIALLLQSNIWAQDISGHDLFVRLAQYVYISALSPLLALLYGAMLIGEDVETNTFSYLLTRPVPRSAWVLGKFTGFFLGGTAMMGASLAMYFLLCTRLADFPLGASSIKTYLLYLAPMSLAIGGYGALYMIFGALFKHPIIWGLIYTYIWQRAAIILPGYVDFTTIEKYVSAVTPVDAKMPNLFEVLVERTGVSKFIIEIGPYTAAATLIGFMIAAPLITAYITRHREYTTATAASG
ncbi:MAG: ABC transporter permease [Candidatus Hydrogenedentota bacterium]|mgnify:CR=1 FL=1